jgi:hypothetical protein
MRFGQEIQEMLWAQLIIAAVLTGGLRIPHPTSVTIAKRPSCGTGCADIADDLRSKSSATDWHDGQNKMARPSVIAELSLRVVQWSNDC